MYLNFASLFRFVVIITKVTRSEKLKVKISETRILQCYRSGSGIRCFLNPGSQTHIFESFVRIFWVKSSIIGQNFFLQHFKNKIVQLCKTYSSKKKV
jgi:hypothetical protein